MRRRLTCERCSAATAGHATDAAALRWRLRCPGLRLGSLISAQHSALSTPIIPSVPGVITVLPEPFASRVESLWDSMTREFGMARGYPGALPHFTYHLAETYDMPRAASTLAAIARETRPFEVETSGIGVFTGVQPVVYIPVARAPALAALHARVCEELRRAGMETDPYYLPERALPHITIAQQNLPPEPGPLFSWLTRQDFSWRVPVTNLALADQTPIAAVVFERFEFGAATRP